MTQPDLIPMEPTKLVGGRILRRIEFFVQGCPKAMPRIKTRVVIPKRNVNKAFAHVYTPPTADDWKTLVRLAFVGAWDNVPFEGPIFLGLFFLFQRPQSHFGKRGLKPNAPDRKTSKPDVDNLSKAVVDALTNAGAWRDDAQVVSHYVEKYYQKDASFGARVVIAEL